MSGIAFTALGCTVDDFPYRSLLRCASMVTLPTELTPFDAEYAAYIIGVGCFTELNAP